MKLGVLTILLLISSAAEAQQHEADTFQPPRAYEAQRYEAGWNKNPFTLKTAPAVVESVSFAKDLAIGAYYGDSTNPTITIVNTKTNERIRLTQDKPAANGMKLSSFQLGSTRIEVVAEVTLGSETASIRCNDSYLRQMAATEMAKAPAAQQQMRQGPGAQQRVQLPPLPSQPFNGAPAPGIAPSTAQAASIPQGQTGFVPPGGARGAVPQLSVAGAPSGTAPLAAQGVGGNSAPTTPERRRLIGPPLNSGAISQ